MDFLQIHDDRQMSLWEYSCIINLKKLIRPTDTYTFLPLPHYDTVVQAVNESDKLRYEWLAGHPDGVYVDTDCMLRKLFIPEAPGKIFLPYLEDEKIPDVFYIVVNKDTSFIKTMFNNKIRVEYLQTVPAEKRDEFYGWPVELNRRMSGYGIIPADYYNHASQTMKQEYRRRYNGRTYETPND